ncbi:MAG: hypothetical protein JEZ08_25415 [Clostridiales bacterium]|nr:hypothetical protein [Clostridiales bacterium]
MKKVLVKIVVACFVTTVGVLNVVSLKTNNVECNLNSVQKYAMASSGEAYPTWDGYKADDNNACCRHRYSYDKCSKYSVSCN